jgi:hypothetical protein
MPIDLGLSVSRERRVSQRWLGRPQSRDLAILFAVALVLRIAVVIWASSRITPTADGVYYEVLGGRIAEGAGYTWLWADGTVTHVAHYPVGLPALIAASYSLFGSNAFSPMLSLAILGALGSVGIHLFVARHRTRTEALFAGLVFALHPDLLSYTPALMTEGLTASLIAIALGFASFDSSSRHPLLRDLATGATIACATLVRPQCLLLLFTIPLVTLLLHGARARVRVVKQLSVLIVTACVLIAPWTLRNGERMDRYALVSVNGGWNLAIGADPKAEGTWAELRVPDACREVFAEAAKDACFGREARQQIAREPIAWIALAPKKLAHTFDYAGAGAWYLHASNPAAFPASAKTVLGALSLLVERLVLVAALLAGFAHARKGIGGHGATALKFALALGIACCLHRHAYVAVLFLCGLCTVGVARHRARGTTATPASVFALLHLGATGAVHVVFFGAGRYGLVVYPALIALAAELGASLRAAKSPVSVSAA